MKTALAACVISIGLCGTLLAEDADSGLTQELLALERGAMEGWRVGNPEPALALLDPDVTYFHYPLQTRLQGLPAVKALFEPYRGRPLFDTYELADPQVQVAGEAAILTYQLVTDRGGAKERWNSSQVFEKKKDGWRIVHAHWSRVQQPAPRQ